MASLFWAALLCVLIAFPMYGAQRTPLNRKAEPISAVAEEFNHCLVHLWNLISLPRKSHSFLDLDDNAHLNDFSFIPFCFSGRKELRDKNKPIELTIQSHRIDSSHVVQLSWQPRVFLYKGFLSDEESDHLIFLARSKESNIKTGNGLESVSTNRRLLSSEVSLDMDDDVIANIQEKLSAWTFLPKENSLPIEVSQFDSEDPMLEHNYHKNQSISESEGLMVTVVMYLSDVQKGGEILFPDSEELQKWSDCGLKNNRLRPIKGNAVLFFSRHLNAAFDNKSSHSRCAIRTGDMWTATKTFYIRAVNGRKSNTESEDSDCVDEDDNCPHWADIGECQRNPLFMVGSPDYYGTCRKSCNSC